MREIRWTEESEDHIARHGVVPAEVEQLLYSRPRLVAKGREDVTLVFGTTDAGRHLVVVSWPMRGMGDCSWSRHAV